MSRHSFLWFNAICCATMWIAKDSLGAPAVDVKRTYRGISPADPRVLNHQVACPPTCPGDCKDVQDLGNGLSGAYAVYLSTDDYRPLVVFCDMTTAGGGWLVFQRRWDGSENFYRNWTEYEDGFGDNIRGTEFWLGLRDLHLLLAQKRYLLRVDLGAFDGSTAYEEYQCFNVGPAINKYILSYYTGSYTGTAGNGLLYNTGMQFSTPDQDNDIHGSLHCARDYNRGGWWYYGCTYSNLNGVYTTDETSTSYTNVFWHYWTNTRRPLKTTEMKFRPM